MKATTTRPTSRVIATAAVAALVVAAVVGCGGPGDSAQGDHTPTGAPAPGATTALQPNGRQLTPAGTQVALGNYSTGAAVSDDGRWLWTISAGLSSNDVRIVDTTTGTVCQTIDIPGASGGVAIDSTHHLAYVAGLPNSRWQPSKNGLPELVAFSMRDSTCRCSR